MWWLQRNWTAEILDEAIARTQLMDAETYLSRALNDQNQARLQNEHKKLKLAKEHDERTANRVIPNAIAFGVTVMLKQKAMAESIARYASTIGLQSDLVVRHFTDEAATTLHRWRTDANVLNRVWNDAYKQLMWGVFQSTDSYRLSNPVVPSVHTVQNYYMLAAEACLMDEVLVSSYEGVAKRHGYDVLKASKVFEEVIQSLGQSQQGRDDAADELKKLYAYHRSEPLPEPSEKHEIQSRYDFEWSIMQDRKSWNAG